MFKLVYFNKVLNMWVIHSVGDWNQCHSLGHDLLKGRTWRIDSLGNELTASYKTEKFKVSWERNLLHTSFATLELANAYILKNMLKDASISIQ